MKTLKCLSLTLLIAESFLISQAYAHHGKDYFINKSYHTPFAGSWVALFGADYLRMNSHREDELRGFGFEPGTIYGLSDRCSFEVHSHIEKLTREHWHYESTGFENRFQITQWDGSEDRNLPIDVAGFLEFEKSSSHESPDILQGGLIFSHDGIPYNITGILLLRKELQPHSSVKLHYTIGAKNDFSSYFGAGIELNGSVEENLLQQLTPGIYFQTESGLKVKLGLSVGVAGNRKDYAIRTSFVLDL